MPLDDESAFRNTSSTRFDVQSTHRGWYGPGETSHGRCRWKGKLSKAKNEWYRIRLRVLYVLQCFLLYYRVLFTVQHCTLWYSVPCLILLTKETDVRHWYGRNRSIVHPGPSIPMQKKMACPHMDVGTERSTCMNCLRVHTVQEDLVRHNGQHHLACCVYCSKYSSKPFMLQRKAITPANGRT